MDEHTLSFAGYLVEADGTKTMNMLCSCGYSTGHCLDWQYAGMLLDDHIQHP